MNGKQRQNLEALRQRNKQLEKALEEANLMILALRTMVEVAEKDLRTSIRKSLVTNGPKSGAQENGKGKCRSPLPTATVKAVKRFISEGFSWISVPPSTC